MATLQDLLAERQQLDLQIARMQSEARTEAIATVGRLMAEYGLTISDLGAKVNGRSPSTLEGKKVTVNYNNSASCELWSGRGV